MKARLKYMVIMCMIIISLLTSCGNIADNSDKSNDSSLVDMDIIRVPGHPVYFDKEESAKDIWEDYLGDEVMISPKNYEHMSESTLIVTYSYSTGGTRLDDIQLYLEHANEKVDLEDALLIAKEYLPIELLKKYYTYEESYVLNTKSEKIHIVYYKITDEGYAERERTRENSIYSMPYQIYIWLWGDEDDIDLIRINGDMDNSYWDTYYERNGIERSDWYYNFIE